VFVGDFSAQAAGDYVTGSNHVLPTSGAARARGGLSAADFVRVATVQTVTRAGIRRIGRDGIALATAEGLSAHAESIRIRWTGVSERAVASEPGERSAPAPFDFAQGAVSASRTAKRRAREPVGESERRSPSDEE
jgi:Histidinol dehydrogenase